MSLRVADIEQWFAHRGWRVFDFQRKAWAAQRAGSSGLIHSPTGTGKSYAAWLGALQAAPAQPQPGSVLWITPLRALAVDTVQSLKTAVDGLGLEWTIGLRTGDTQSAERTRQRKRLPNALVTTPESLSLLLSYADTAKQLRQVSTVVVDEWHELMGNKRGVLLQLSLARLRALSPGLRVWGLSATIGNVPQAAACLLGPGAEPVVINGALDKRTDIAAILPPDIHSFPWAGHGGLKLLPQVADAIAEARSTLVFCNTRNQAERWYEALIRHRLDWIDKVALHHGSLDRTLRSGAEQLLRHGKLACVVATSSLDLGVDFSPVEQVIQIGSPKGVARLLQRAGRSGHQPGQPSTVLCVPTHAFELTEIAAARAAAADGRIEDRLPPQLSLDVLAQHVVSMALAGGASASTLLAEARSTQAFCGLSDTAWAWVLDFVTRGGSALAAYPEFQRVDREGDALKVSSRRVAQRHRMAVGTISSDASLQVKFQKGGYLGHIEESFISRLKPGDAFQFAGRKLQLVRVKDMAAHVKLARGKQAAIPRWQGGRLPLSTELADAVLEQLVAFERGETQAPELQKLAPLLVRQRQSSALPGPQRLLIERSRSREGVSVFVFPFAGRLVHEGLGALMAWRLAQQQSITFSIAVNDYGFELLSRDDCAFDEATFRNALSANQLQTDILAAVNATEMARRQFRDIARIAGLVFQGYPGSQKSTRQVQASSGLIYDVLTKYDPDNLLPAQALDEVLAAQFEVARLRACLQRLEKSQFVLTEPERLSPLAFPIWADRLRNRLSSERWQDRVRAMQARVDSD